MTQRSHKEKDELIKELMEALEAFLALPDIRNRIYDWNVQADINDKIIKRIENLEVKW